MAVHGYLTHAAQNRRRTVWLILLYVLSFELLGTFASTLFLLTLDAEHTILSNPLGYLLRYALPIAVLAGFVFWRLYRGHARSVAGRLGIRLVTRVNEARFVDIAETQCLALGVHLPRFGVLETAELNALAVGEGPKAGMIAVTRGLLDALDDDELAAVCAHEASHIRLGDTRLLAANHALMRTAVILQTHNPLRLEDVRQMLIAVLLPPVLLPMLIGSAATMASLQLARVARRGLRLGRDHIADGEAVRLTHFPEALISAIRKIEGRGAFPGSYAVAGLLFDAPADREIGRRASAADRMEAIAKLGGEMMVPGRSRRDTRSEAPQSKANIWRAMVRPGSRFPRDAEGKPLTQPPTPTLRMLWLRISDPEAFHDWQNACTDWWEWRVGDRRNVLGLTPKMVLATVATLALLLLLHRPADGDLRSYMRVFNPAGMVEIARMIRTDFGCQGATGHGSACLGPPQDSAPAKLAEGSLLRSGFAADTVTPEPIYPSAPPIFMPMLLFGLVGLGIFRPKLLKKLFGQVD